MIVTKDIPSRGVLAKMEDVHPESIRWDIEDKEHHVHNVDTLGYWLYNGDGCIGEYLVSRRRHKVAGGDSISILPKYTGKGYAKFLTEYVLKDLAKLGYEEYEGEARPGASWHIIESLGGIKTGVSVNHGGTGEDYIRFSLPLPQIKEEIELFNPLTTDREVFCIRRGYAYVGYKIPNGDFHYEMIPYTEPEWSRKFGSELTSELPGVDNSQVKPSNPQMVKEVLV